MQIALLHVTVRQKWQCGGCDSAAPLHYLMLDGIISKDMEVGGTVAN